MRGASVTTDGANGDNQHRRRRSCYLPPQQEVVDLVGALSNTGQAMLTFIEENGATKRPPWAEVSEAYLRADRLLNDTQDAEDKGRLLACALSRRRRGRAGLAVGSRDGGRGGGGRLIRCVSPAGSGGLGARGSWRRRHDLEVSSMTRPVLGVSIQRVVESDECSPPAVSLRGQHKARQRERVAGL